MDLNKLYEILADTTLQLRKDEAVEHRQAPGLDITEVYAMPHESEARPDIEKVDCEFVVLGVDKGKAEQHRAELIEILDSYPRPDRLADGPSYIEVGAEIGDQGAAFQLFALGKVLGLWTVITPATMGITGDEARQLAGSGFVMMSGYRRATAAAPEPLGSTEEHR